MSTNRLSDRAGELLDAIEHASVATASSDGRPWNTPVYFARQTDSLYWISRRDAQHSNNIQHNGRAFIVVFDSTREDATGAGVYLETAVTRLDNDGDILGALELICRRRNRPVLPPSLFSRDSVHAVYRARVIHAWSNVLHTSDEIPWDERIDITLR